MTKISPDDPTTTAPEPSTNGKVASKKFDIGKMREAARQYSATGGFGGKEELITVPVYCPPPPDEFIRVRDDDDYWIECMTLDYTAEKGGTKTYFIDPELMDILPAEIKNLTKWSRLYTAMIRRGKVTFLWRIKVYGSGPGELSTATALNCAERARQVWLRVGWQNRKGYTPYESPGDYGDPQWTEHTFEDLLDIAFQTTYIDSLDHAVIRALMDWDV